MSENKITNVLIVGVGGQGIILASEILSRVAMDAGLDVKKSEIHGMAQRGGSVNSQVRFGAKVNSPVIKKNTVDILLSFELIEPLRWVEFLKNDSKLIVNTQKIHSLTTATQQQVYPDGVTEELLKKFPSAVLLDVLSAAKEIGNIRVVNVFLLGVLSTILEFPEEAWIKAIDGRVPAKALEVNHKAFAAGRAYKD